MRKRAEKRRADRGFARSLAPTVASTKRPPYFVLFVLSTFPVLKRARGGRTKDGGDAFQKHKGVCHNTGRRRRRSLLHYTYYTLRLRRLVCSFAHDAPLLPFPLSVIKIPAAKIFLSPLLLPPPAVPLRRRVVLSKGEFSSPFSQRTSSSPLFLTTSAKKNPSSKAFGLLGASLFSFAVSFTPSILWPRQREHYNSEKNERTTMRQWTCAKKRTIACERQCCVGPVSTLHALQPSA